MIYHIKVEKNMKIVHNNKKELIQYLLLIKQKEKKLKVDYQHLLE